jgi:hypothetical protein
MPLSELPNGDWTNTGDTVISDDTVISLANTSFTNNGTLDVVSGKGHTLNTLSVNDTDFGTQADNGMINNGLMIAEKASFISLSTVVGGTGTIEIDKGGIVYLRSQTSSGNVELRGGTLQFGGSNEFYATITEMTKGSMIELLGTAADNGNLASVQLTQVQPGLESLTAYNTTGGGAFTGLIEGNFTSSDFRVSNVGGNSFITLTHTGH